MNTAQQCRLLAAQARVNAAAVPAERDNYLAIAREYEAIAAAMEARHDGAAVDDLGQSLVKSTAHFWM